MFAISAVGSTITIDSIPTWYAGLNKPETSPPNWVFGPVWTTLYIMIAISGWRVWQMFPNARFAAKFYSPLMRPYWVQILLNALWTPVFFGLQSPLLGAIVITFLYAAILWNIAVFNKADKPASYLLIPYVLWVSFALHLNHAILALN
ncbi:MAG: TspO/MBR family protein [Alphaproteobacteria bacterium]